MLTDQHIDGQPDLINQPPFVGIEINKCYSIAKNMLLWATDEAIHVVWEPR